MIVTASAASAGLPSCAIPVEAPPQDSSDQGSGAGWGRSWSVWRTDGRTNDLRLAHVVSDGERVRAWTVEEAAIVEVGLRSSVSVREA